MSGASSDDPPVDGAEHSVRVLEALKAEAERTPPFGLASIVPVSRGGGPASTKYRLARRLGAGGFGEAWLADELVGTRRQVVVKRLRPERAHDEEMRRRLLHEAEALSRFSHPNAVVVHTMEPDASGVVETGEGEGPWLGPCLVLEYVEGEDLYHLKKPMSPRGALAIAKAILDALAAAHAVGLIHRDLSPHNVRVRPDGTVKVLDFGLAHIVREATPKGSGSTESVPARAGTLGYIAPDPEPTAVSDIYSVGVLLFEMLTGEHPSENKHALRFPLRRVADLRPDVPSRLSEAIAVALELDPARRFQSAKAFHDALASGDPRGAPAALLRLADLDVAMTREPSGLLEVMCGIWATACVKPPRYLRRSLSYEPRAARMCDRCATLLLGTKSGGLFAIPTRAPERFHLVHQFETSVRSVDGCPECPEGAVVGTGNGRVLVVPGAGAPDNAIVWAPAASPYRLAAVRKFAYPLEGAEDDRHLGPDTGLFIADEGRRLRVTRLRCQHPLAALEIPWAPRWVSGSRSDADGRDHSWMLVSTDGRLARVRFREGDLRFEPLPPLPRAPSCVAFTSRSDGTPLVIFGDRAGVQALPVRGDAADPPWTLLEEQDIHFIARRPVFGGHLLVACGPNGWLATATMTDAPPPRPLEWIEWPRLESDGLGVWFAACSPDQDKTTALAVLRDDRIAYADFHNEEVVRSYLVQKPAHAWRGATDEERYAHLTAGQSIEPATVLRYGQLGGPRTADGILAWLRRDHPLRPDQAVEVSASILIAASRVGHHEVVRLAGALHQELVRRARAFEGSDWDHLQDWLKFLDKHFLHGWTFSEKRTHLESLITANAPRRTADAFVYAARLRKQGFDVLQEVRGAGVWAMAAKPTASGGAVLAVADGEGAIWRADLASQFEPVDPQWVLKATSIADEGAPEPIPSHDVHARGGSRNSYTRVLAFLPDTSGTSWPIVIACPRRPRDERPGLSTPPVSPAPHDDATQVYAMHRLDSRSFLLGTRDLHRPLMLWEQGRAKPLLRPVTIEPRRRPNARRLPTPGSCRIWSIAPLDPNGGSVLAVGAQDGLLRRFHYEVARMVESHDALFLGDSVRTLSSFEVGPGDTKPRAFLAAGTEAGELFVFEVLDPSGHLTLKFREVFRHPVFALFTDAGSPGGRATRLFAVDGGGRMTSFDLGPFQRGAYLGRRNRHYEIVQHATAAVWLGQERVAVGSWDPARREGLVRIVQLTDRERVTAAVRGVEHARARAREFVGNRHDELLASFPLGDGSVRAAVVGDRFTAALATGASVPETVVRLFAEAEAYPHDLEEYKALLDRCRSLIDDEQDLDRAATLVRATIDALVDRAGKLTLKRAARPLLRAAILRRLVSGRVLRLWRRAGLDEDRLSRWIEVHLHDAEPVVRQETLRALASALHELVRAPGKDAAAVEEAFPRASSPSRPRAAWVLELVAQYLRAHQSAGSTYDCEIDSMGWGASSVMVNLLRLFPDEVLVSMDYLSALHVHGAIVHLLERRLTSPKDPQIVRKLNFYRPWDEAEPTRGQLLDRCGTAEIERLGMQPSSPDAMYVRRFRRAHDELERFLHATDRRGLELLAEHYRHEALTTSQSSVPLLPRLNTDDESLIPVIHWINAARSTLWNGTGALEQALSLQEERLFADARALPGPEREIALATLRSWHVALVPRPTVFPERIGSYEIEGSFKNSPSVYTVKNRPELLMVMVLGRSNARVAELREIWRLIYSISRYPASKLVPIVDFVDELQPALVLKRLPGDNLKHLWSALLRKPPEERARLAMRLLLDIVGQLFELHQVGVFHDDVVRRNILFVSSESRFYLVDFDRVGRSWGAAREGDSEGDYERRRGGSPAILRSDVENLVALVVHLVANEESVGKLDPSGSVVPRFGLQLESEVGAWLDWLGDLWEKMRDPNLDLDARGVLHDCVDTIAAAHERAGELHRKRKRAAEAHAELGKAMSLRVRLANADRTHQGWQLEAARACLRAGDAAKAAGDRAAAEDAYRRARELGQSDKKLSNKARAGQRDL